MQTEKVLDLLVSLEARFHEIVGNAECMSSGTEVKKGLFVEGRPYRIVVEVLAYLVGIETIYWLTNLMLVVGRIARLFNVFVEISYWIVRRI